MDVEAYAALMVELSFAGAARDAVLAKHGLDEDRWAAIDARFQDLLSEAMDEDGDGISPFLARYAAAYEAAQRAAGPPIPLERFALVTRLFSASGDLRGALAKANVSLAEYVRASEHWSRLMTGDPDLERRFEQALRRS